MNESNGDKAVFRIFRKINILEYKNPHDALNRRVIRKVCGYANLYIGVAEHERERPEDQVTISIFRAVRNPELFEEMEKEGTLVRDRIPGIYHVKGYTNLPFQIIITGELEGEEYAAYRALTDKADEADVERIMEGAGRDMDDAIREHYKVLLRLVIEKNPQFIETIRRDNAMEDVLMEIVKDRVDEKVSTAVDTERQQTTVIHIKDIMDSFGVTLERAMDSLKIPQSERKTYAGLVGNYTR